MARHLVNDPFDAVDDMMRGVTAAHHDRVALTASGRGLYTRDSDPRRRISVVVGGGSGHEPAFLGWVGPGLADAAAVGNVFAAPAADPVVEVVQALDRPDGALFLFGNYEGDVMNFRLAGEFLADTGIASRTVLITDDVASAPAHSPHKRRGVAGGVVVAKAAGALADRGASLDDVAALAESVNDATRSIGVALSSCHLPAAARPTFELPDTEMGFGIGVHGETGLSRRTRGTAAETAAQLVHALLDDQPALAGSRALVLVNTFGATPLMEAYIVLGEAVELLRKEGTTPVFAHAGAYLTSLQMAGVSLTTTLLTPETEALIAAPGSPLTLPPLGGSR
ncbi:dihydroxyacetone kinase subunit DhaK [Streptomyces sp. SID3343]|uniref:dihydroxyacetone kinase subunit DhaK n=1 Tax=Streptomyces sp. SID3343 TaxID=2690260 RepID=UPI00136BA5D0|nr:dihydroxyacetone kinase subunit DhaK [Streptomyces sp. SID3343]MYW01408.1 dihydroxyacetone kinase [Streptomyces sp. SID3343]